MQHDMVRWAGMLVVAVALQLGTAGAARARESALAEAWLAHEQLDFERAIDEAEQRIASGQLSPQELADAHLVIGRSHAAMRHTDDARRAFIVALALAPSLRLPEHASPVETSPFMEARGYWLDYDVRLDVNAAEADEAWEVSVVDPAGVAYRLLVLGKAPGPALGELEAPDGVTLEIPFTQPAYEVALVGRAGNQLVRLELPQPVPPPPVAAAAPAPKRKVDPTRDRRRRQLLAASYTQLAVGAASALTGLGLHLRRERLADLWNGPECEAPGGGDRGTQCGHILDQIDTAERAAIGLYVTGGAAILGSLITLGIAKRRYGEDRQAVACAPAGLGAVCHAAF